MSWFQRYILNNIPLLGLYKRKVLKKEIHYFKCCCPDGAVVLTYTPRAWWNFFIEGEWKHAATFIEGKFYEATAKHGAIKTDITKFLTTKEKYIVLRPDFLGRNQVTRYCFLIKEAVRKNVPYDWFFSLKNKRVYCSELIYRAMLKSMMNKPPFGEFGKIITPSELDNGSLTTLVEFNTDKARKNAK